MAHLTTAVSGQRLTVRQIGLLFLALSAVPSAGAAQAPVYRVILEDGLRSRAERVLERAVTAAAEAGAAALVLVVRAAPVDGATARRLAEVLRRGSVPAYAWIARDPGPTVRAVALAVDRVFVETGVRLPWAPDSGAGSPQPVSDFDAVLSVLGADGARVVTVDARWLGATVRVENDNWRDVRVFVARGGQRRRLGTVTSMNAREWTLPDTELPMAGRIHLVAEVIGTTERATTPPVPVEAGVVIEWRIANMLSQSSAHHWVRN